MEVQKTKQATLEVTMKKMLLEDSTMLKKVIMEIFAEDKSILKNVLEEVMFNKIKHKKEERSEMIERLIDEDFEKYDAVFKALA